MEIASHVVLKIFKLKPNEMIHQTNLIAHKYNTIYILFVLLTCLLKGIVFLASN